MLYSLSKQYIKRVKFEFEKDHTNDQKYICKIIRNGQECIATASGVGKKGCKKGCKKGGRKGGKQGGKKGGKKGCKKGVKKGGEKGGKQRG